MFEIDYDPESDKIIINGASAAKLLKGRAGTALSVILHFQPDGPDRLIAVSYNRPGTKIAEAVRVFENNGISNQLSNAAKKSLEEYVRYLRSFKSSSENGREIHGNPPKEIAVPYSFKRKLKNFQVPSVKHLVEVTNSANFSVPGSGKTTMVLAGYSILKERKEVSKLVVICPRSAFEPWTEEYLGCFGREPESIRLTGTPQERKKLLADSQSVELFLCTYQMLSNEKEAIGKILKKYPCLLILDESHHIKKGSGGVWYDAVNEIAPLARRRVILTGTPAPNQLEDIVPQFEILWPILNPAKKAMDLYGSNDKIEDFRETLNPYYTRVRKDQLGLPQRQFVKMDVPLGPVQQQIYDVLCRRILSKSLLKIEERSLIRDLRKALMVRLLQAASNPTLLAEYSDEFKVPPLSPTGVDLEELIRNYSSYEIPKKLVAAANLAKKLSVEEGRKSIIWTSFIHNAETINKLVNKSGINSIVVTGNTTKDESQENCRDSLLHQFKTDPSTQVLVATIPSIAESVSLHKECHEAIYVDRTFNCGLFMQSMDRIHRVGLPPHTDTRYWFLIGTGTLDEIIETRLKQKMDVMHRILNDDIGILDLDIPDDLSEGDWDDEDVAAVLEHLRQFRTGQT
ncbi:MAG: DEAD/DEAH box helicase [Methanoregula sp.]